MGKALDMLFPVVRATKVVSMWVACQVHGGQCTLKSCSWRAGGSPCTDNSSMGTHSGDEGATMVDTPSWLATILYLEHEIFVSENAFPEQMLSTMAACLGHLYHLEVAKNNGPTRLGWPVSRPRQ